METITEHQPQDSLDSEEQPTPSKDDLQLHTASQSHPIKGHVQADRDTLKLVNLYNNHIKMPHEDKIYKTIIQR